MSSVSNSRSRLALSPFVVPLLVFSPDRAPQRWRPSHPCLLPSIRSSGLIAIKKAALSPSPQFGAAFRVGKEGELPVRQSNAIRQNRPNTRPDFDFVLASLCTGCGYSFWRAAISLGILSCLGAVLTIALEKMSSDELSLQSLSLSSSL